MNINIGFDFGTSSTKVCYYDLENEKHFFFVFEHMKNNLSRYCLPSIIRFEKEKVYFDEAGSDDVKFRLFKLDIEVESYGPIRPHILNPISGKDLVTIYCAYVISKVKDFLRYKYPNANLIYQFGIPIDHLTVDGQPLSKKEDCFYKAFGTAERLANMIEIKKGEQLERILELLKKAENEFLGTPKELKKIAIYPETMAGIAALLKDDTLEHRYRYSIVDIGAGTTDLSFFQYSNVIESEGKFYVYNSKTLNIGTENFHELEPAKNEIKDSFNKGFRESYSRCPQYWSDNYKLLFLGGGSEHDLKQSLNAVEHTIHGNGRVPILISPDETVYPKPFEAYDAVNDGLDTWEKYFKFLGISYGLSFPNQFMPNYNPQVPPLQRNDTPYVGFEPLTPDVG